MKLSCFQEVYDRLACGYPATDVARYIQKEQGECTDTPTASLVNQLKRYRKKILPEDVLTNRIPHIIVDAHKRYNDKLEELRRLDYQYEALVYRFDLLHGQERKDGRIDPQVDRVSRSILQVIVQMHSIKMDLGINGQKYTASLEVAPERLEEIRRKYGEGAAKAMANPVSRARVLAVLKAAEDRAKMMEGEEERSNRERKEGRWR